MLSEKQRSKIISYITEGGLNEVTTLVNLVDDDLLEEEYSSILDESDEEDYFEED